MYNPGQSSFFTHFDPEDIQRNVWFWRRRRAGHLQDAEDGVPAAEYVFSEEVVLKADRAFLAMYRRPPEPREWQTVYLLLLQQLARDPAAYDFMFGDGADEAIRPQFTPQSTTLRRIERPRSSGNSIPMLLAGVVLLGAFGIGSVAFGRDVPVLPVALVMTVSFVGLAIAAPIMANATDVSYMCPECGCEYAESHLARCQRCHLEFGNANVAWQTAFGIEPPAETRRRASGAGDRT